MRGSTVCMFDLQRQTSGLSQCSGCSEVSFFQQLDVIILPVAESTDVPMMLPVMTTDQTSSESWYDSLAGPEICDWLDSLTD